MSRPALAASRAVTILNFLAARPGESFSLSELVHHLDLNVASCHALLSVLAREGYLIRHPKHRTYSLGPALVAVGHAALEAHPAIDAARDMARELAIDLKLEVLLTARIGDELVALAQAGHSAASSASLAVGQRLPLIPPLGSAFMAWAATDDVTRWLSRREPPLNAAARADYSRALALVHRRGYAVTLRTPVQAQLRDVVTDLSTSPQAPHLYNRLTELIGALETDLYLLTEVDPHRHYDVGLMSAPIFDAHGHVAYTLSLLGFKEPLSALEIEHFAKPLMTASLLVMRRTSGRFPPSIARSESEETHAGARLY